MKFFRTRIKRDIVAEVTLPTRRAKRGDRVVILCPGFPSMPGKTSLLEFFMRKGYVTILPRYRGTWESGGVFLEHSPERDIEDILDTLSKETLRDVWSDEIHTVTPREIILIGSSFGGALVLLLSCDPRVTKVITLSPVVDWTIPSKAEPLDWLYSAVRVSFGEATRVSKKNWNKLKRGTFFNPMHHVGNIEGSKILIFHTKDDEIVAPRSVRAFAKRVGCTLVLRARGGHLSLRSITRPLYWKRTLSFLKK